MLEPESGSVITFQLHTQNLHDNIKYSNHGYQVSMQWKENMNNTYIFKGKSSTNCYGGPI